MFDYVKIQITGHLNIKGRAIRQLRNLIILGICRASCVLVSRDIYPKLLQPCYSFCICRTSPCATDLLFHFQCSRNLLYKHREFDINQQKLTSKPSVLSSSIIQSFFSLNTNLESWVSACLVFLMSRKFFRDLLLQLQQFQTSQRAAWQFMLGRAKEKDLLFQFHTWLSLPSRTCYVKLRKNSVLIIQRGVLQFPAEKMCLQTSPQA